MRGIWRGKFFTGYPGGYVEIALETAISLHRGSVGEPGRGLVYRFWGMFKDPPFLGSLREEKVSFS